MGTFLVCTGAGPGYIFSLHRGTFLVRIAWDTFYVCTGWDLFSLYRGSSQRRHAKVSAKKNIVGVIGNGLLVVMKHVYSSCFRSSLILTEQLSNGICIHEMQLLNTATMKGTL
jgi:hypothetical protein